MQWKLPEQLGSIFMLLHYNNDTTKDFSSDVMLQCRLCNCDGTALGRISQLLRAVDKSSVVVQGFGYIVAEKNGQLLVCSLKGKQRIKEFGKCIVNTQS